MSSEFIVLNLIIFMIIQNKPVKYKLSLAKLKYIG